MRTYDYFACSNGHRGEETTTENDQPIPNPGSARFRLEFDRYLQGPKEANALRVMQHGCRLLQGPIIDGCNEPAGGWLLIDVEPHELPLEPPANLNGWQ